MRRVYLKEWRDHRGLTQEEVAARIGKSHSTLGRIENAKVPYNEVWLVLLADVYRCEPADLISRHPTEDPIGIYSLYERFREPEQQRTARRVLEALASGAD